MQFIPNIFNKALENAGKGALSIRYKASQGSSALTGGIILNFIFSWIFLLLALAAFLLGGHLERYACQGLIRNQNEELPILKVSLARLFNFRY